MPEVVFEEPPRTRVQHAIVVAALRERPGEWARVGVYATPGSAHSLARQIKRATLNAWAPAGAFEAVGRTVKGEHRVYARYVGGADGAAG